MAEATETVETIKTASDGMVKITIEKYNELVETVASQKGSLSSLREQLARVRAEPPVINRTIIHKTPEMVAGDHRVWGTTFMGTGALLFGLGVFRFRAGRTGS